MELLYEKRPIHKGDSWYDITIEDEVRAAATHDVKKPIKVSVDEGWETVTSRKGKGRKGRRKYRNMY